MISRREVMAAGLACSVPAWAQGSGNRVALVIGNAAYAAAPLPNAANDAKAMSAALRGMGFEVIEVRDAGKQRMEEGITLSRAMLQGRSGVGLLYYAGHGLQVDWRNYMVPVDAQMASAADVPKAAVDIQGAIDAFRSAGNRMNIVVLDACRDNPFSSAATGKGLAPLDAPPGTYLAYATAPGNYAEDGDTEGGNGLYTRYLLKELQRPDAKIEEIFRRVRFQVRQASKGRQVPWDMSSLEDEFVFATGRKAETESRSGREQAFLREREEWERIKAGSSGDELYAFLQRNPNGAFAEQAQFRLERLALSGVEAQRLPQQPAVLPILRDRYRVGDEFEYDVSDFYERTVKVETKLVTAVLHDRVEVNQGAETWDLMGNFIKNSLGDRSPARVFFPAELYLGKSWRTDYVIRHPEGQDTLFYNCRVVALEDVEVPAGRFRAYRIEASGWGGGSNGSNYQLNESYWVDPGVFVRIKSVWVQRANGRIASSSRYWLRAFRQVVR